MTTHDHEQTRAAWDKIAPGYDEFVTATHMELGSEGLRRAELRPGMRFLDVAAGSGALSIPAARLGAQVLATDQSPVMLERLSARARNEGLDVETRVMTAIRMEELAEPYIRRRAQRHLEKKRVVLFAGGTGNPYFSTDTAAVLRALEIEAELLIKATNVDGVYSADPKQDPNAEFLPELTFQEAIVRGLRVMDANAFGLCKENSLPIVIMNVNQQGAVERVLRGERVGTLVR